MYADSHLVMCSHRCMHANPEIDESGGTVRAYLGAGRVWGHAAEKSMRELLHGAILGSDKWPFLD